MIALRCSLRPGVTNVLLPNRVQSTNQRLIHITPCYSAVQAGRPKVTRTRTNAVTYEQANPPYQIAHRKAWNSWNTTTLQGGLRTSETIVDDQFIRKFMVGTFPQLIVSQIIIKRQHNIIRIGGIFVRKMHPRKYYFLLGYAEELLSHWLQCPVKIEMVTIEQKEDVIIKYI